MRSRAGLYRFLFLLGSMVFTAIGLLAQGGVGDLTGLVTDQTKAVVPNADVTLTNSATGEVRKATTSSAGIYRFTALTVVGKYNLTVAHSGFKNVDVKDIVISVGTVVTNDVTLNVGGTGETVTVEGGGSPLVQTSESQVSQLIDQRVWESMPLEDRSQNEFINLVAGAVPNDFAAVEGSNRGASVNGARTGAGNFMVDGYDNNDQGQGGRGVPVGPGGAGTTISPDAIQEYRVIDNDFAAEYGKAGGFVTDTVLKSGVNQWHGSLFWYNRVQALAANNWFSDHVGIQDKLIRNQEGGSIGGPIWKDKTFFYATYERHDELSSVPFTGVGFTQEFLNFVNSGAFETFQETNPGGACMALAGAACPGAFNLSSKLGPVFNNLMSTEPGAFPIAPVTSGPCTPTNTDCISEGVYTGGLLYPVHIYGNVTASDPSFVHQNRASLKMDHKISDRDQLSFSYIIDDSLTGDQLGGGDGTFGVPFTNPARAQNAGVTWNHLFTDNFLNQFRFGYNRHRLDFPDNANNQTTPSILTFDALSGSFGNSSNLPQFFTENLFQYKDDMSYTKGKHNLKWGGEYRRTRNGSSFQAIKNGLFELWSVEDLVTDATFDDQADKVFGAGVGAIPVAEASINPQTGQLPIFYRGYRANEVDLYVQDDYRILPRFTLNAGLRWEYFGPPHNFIPNMDSNFFFGQPFFPKGFAAPSNPFFPINSPLAAMENTGSFQIRNSSIWDKDLNNFAPRLGFAYDVLGSGKIVVRGGYGIAYDRMYNNIFENIRFNPPLFDFATLGFLGNGLPAGALSTPGLYSANFDATSLFAAFPSKPSARHMDQDLKTAYYQQGHLGVQWQFARNFVLETNYIGSWGSHLLGERSINTYDGRLACASASPACTAAFVAGEIASATFGTTRPNTTIGSDGFRTSGFSSNYNALELTVRHNFASGLQFSSSYTYSKALDALSDVFNSRLGGTFVEDSQNPRMDYGPSDFNIKHRSVTSLYYELPWKKNSLWLGGFSATSIISLQSGQPFSVFDSSGTYDPNKDGITNDRISYIGTGSITNGITGHSPANGYLNTAMFAPTVCSPSQNFGLWCDGGSGRNALTGPAFYDTDFGVAKKFPIHERLNAQIQANFFNLFNHPNFHNPVSDFNSTNFGSAIQAYSPRVTQLALRFDF